MSDDARCGMVAMTTRRCIFDHDHDGGHDFGLDPAAVALRRASGGISEQNARGEWVSSIPLPFTLRMGRVRCKCGYVVRGVRRYREHYAYTHILGIRP